jgi:hypothetical protein
MEKSSSNDETLTASEIISLSPLIFVTIAFLYFIAPNDISALQKFGGILIGANISSIGILVIAKKTIAMDSTNEFTTAKTVKFVSMLIIGLFVVPFAFSSLFFYVDIVSVINELNRRHQ